ncbi:MAG TPA: PD-(D/E)XK nuclease family protein [Candidatus Acidoferrales bacterium]|nr:PD-(D/E)XK nuclease family protein [Candidatus Acidoferrales bacterium]
MDNADSAACRNAAVARRIGVSIALAQVAADQKAFASFSQASRAVLADDLCSLSYATDAAGASDADLACAVMEPDRGASFAARVAYAARLHLRAAWIEIDRVSQGAPGARESRAAVSLGGAARTLRELGASSAFAPRALVNSLGRERQENAHAVLRFVQAAYRLDAGGLVEALQMPPFSIDPADLAIALRGQTGPPREALAAAVVQMHGGATKDRAIGALEVLDAVLESGASTTGLARAIEAALTAIASFDSGWSVKHSEAFNHSVETADQLFDRAAPATKPGDRAREVADAVSVAELDGLRLVPYVGSSEVQATIAFAQDAASPLDIERFARVAGVDVASFVELCRPRPVTTVASSSRFALAEFIRQRDRRDASRSWPQPETETAILAPQMTFSASRLNSYVKCPRRFFFEYMCESLEDSSSLHATYGRVVHDALEMLHREVRLPAKHDAAHITERLLRHLDAAFGAARAEFASQLEYESSRWRARRMAEQYVRWLVAEAQRAPMEISAVEVFERRRLGAYDFIGYIDRIDRPEAGGPVTIYDYKTGRIESDAKAYLEKVRAGDEAQLALYYAMRRAAGDEIARIALVSVRDPKDEVWILALDLADAGSPNGATGDRENGVVRAVCSPADLDASLAALLRRCDMLAREGVTHFPPGADPPCGFCEYAQACRERPLEGERAFAR